ncbi:MAG: aldo/keto reductase [Anaeromyxobacter sp.]
MQRRSFPKIPSLQLSTLGLGAMRLPTLPGEPGKPAAIDEARAAGLVHAAIEAGVNYLDTAWVYHGGQSEPFLGRALRGGWREKVQLATKCPVWEVQSAADAERILEEQLRRLETDHVDFYLLHALDGARWKAVRKKAIPALERARKDGRIRHLGFSFHGAYRDFKEIIDAYDWAFTQIQLNYLDTDYQAGLAGLAYAAQRRVGVVVMEPLRGGALAKAPPEVVQRLAQAGRPWSPASWALRWVWSQPGVVTVLSGMGQLEELRENVASAAEAAPLTAAELAAVEAATAFYRARMAVDCTTCGYCQPCPSGVAVPDIFAHWNSAAMFEDAKGAAWAYRTFQLGSGHGADQCNQCGHCETMCPQELAIPELLEKAHEALTR